MVSKQGYFLLIKAAKAQHSNSTLPDATAGTLSTAQKLAIRTVTPKFPNLADSTCLNEGNNALLTQFFPLKLLPVVPSCLRPYKGCNPLLASEILAALGKWG